MPSCPLGKRVTRSLIGEMRSAQPSSHPWESVRQESSHEIGLLETEPVHKMCRTWLDVTQRRRELHHRGDLTQPRAALDERGGFFPTIGLFLVPSKRDVVVD